MFTCDFSKRGDLSMSSFLCECIKEKITDGTIAQGEKLPSKRALALHLGVSVTTVEAAYDNLIAAGVLYSVEKRGFFVSRHPVPQARQAPMLKIAPSSANGDTRAETFDLLSNAVAWRKFPFSLWAGALREALHEPREELLLPQGAAGSLALRTSIADYLAGFRGMKVSPSNIVVAAGSEALIALVANLLGRGAHFAAENPGYKKITSLLEMNGCQVSPVFIDEQGMDVASLESTGARTAHVCPSHHFPTGVVMSSKRRDELLSWATGKEGRFILEDEFDSEFRFEGKPLPPLKAEDADHVIYMNTFSKTLSAAFRIGYVVLPNRLMSTFLERFSFLSCTVPSFDQTALASFIADGHYERHLLRMKNYYKNLRDELMGRIQNSALNDLLAIHEGASGLHFLLECRSQKEHINLPRLRSAFEENGVLMSPLASFFLPCEQHKTAFLEEIDADGSFVVNYSGVEKQAIAHLVDRLTASFRSAL